MRRIHIVAIAPRTGTTLLAEAMRHCFTIDGFHAREAPIQARVARAEVHLSKHPGDLAFIGPRLRLDPRLHVICMVRDPRDIVVSENWSRPGRYFWDFSDVRTGVRRLQRYADHHRFIVIRYEELVADPARVQRDLERRMPFLERTADFREFHVVARDVSEGNSNDMHGVRPINTASIGNWRQHLPRIADQREGMTAALVELGYETDASWERVLDGVLPVAQPRLPAPPGRRWLWLTPTVRRPLRWLWQFRWRIPRRAHRVLDPPLEGLRGLLEYLIRSERG